MKEYVTPVAELRCVAEILTVSDPWKDDVEGNEV